MLDSTTKVRNTNRKYLCSCDQSCVDTTTADSLAEVTCALAPGAEASEACHHIIVVSGHGSHLDVCCVCGAREVGVDLLEVALSIPTPEINQHDSSRMIHSNLYKRVI